MSSEGPSGEVPHSALPGDQRGRIEGEGYIDSESHIEGSDARENAALWVAVLGSAVVWFVQMQTSYSLLKWACSIQRNWPLHLLSAVFLILGAVPGVIGWKEWRANAGSSTERKSAGAGRRRFMAMLGMMLTAIFLLLIFAQAIPSFFFDPCLK
ncbi:MAG TPA: hypothetical protein VH207_11950 [Chthoniobacterales bacterium]|nr:hypothetical protein [Chthoniobacterales bacterium]